EELLPFLGAGQRLIQTEVNFVRGVDTTLLVNGRGDRGCGPTLGLDGLRTCAELCHRSLERTEVVNHRLIDEDVAVCKVEDPLLSSTFPEPPDDLEGRVGLARACRHDEQYTILTLCDGLGCSIDGVALVVPRLSAAAVIEVVLQNRSL